MHMVDSGKTGEVCHKAPGDSYSVKLGQKYLRKLRQIIMQF